MDKGDEYLKKRGEAYIDVVVGVFLSMLILALSIELFNFFNAYHKLRVFGVDVSKEEIQDQSVRIKQLETENRFLKLELQQALDQQIADKESMLQRMKEQENDIQELKNLVKQLMEE